MVRGIDRCHYRYLCLGMESAYCHSTSRVTYFVCGFHPIDDGINVYYPHHLLVQCSSGRMVVGLGCSDLFCLRTQRVGVSTSYHQIYSGFFDVCSWLVSDECITQYLGGPCFINFCFDFSVGGGFWGLYCCSFLGSAFADSTREP